MAKQVELDHKYFIMLALKNEIAWSAPKFIIEGLTPTLEKSKEVNRFLLLELEKFHAKFRSLEKDQTGNHDTVTESENCFIKTPEQGDTLENVEGIEDAIEVLEVIKERMNVESSKSHEEQKYTDDSEADNLIRENKLHNSEHNFKNHYEREIDNEWYTFDSNDKAEMQVKAKETEVVKDEIVN